MPSGPPALLVPTEHLALSPSSKAFCELTSNAETDKAQADDEANHIDSQ